MITEKGPRITGAETSKIELRPRPVASGGLLGPTSAKQKEPRKLLIPPEIFDFESDLGLKLGRTKPRISGTAPTNRHTTIPNDSGPISACFDDDPKLLNCEIAQPSYR